MAKVGAPVAHLVYGWSMEAHGFLVFRKKAARDNDIAAELAADQAFTTHGP
jgi:hypothetical protein